MKTIYYSIKKRSMNTTMKLLSMAFFILPSSCFISCSDILDTDSELVQFQEDNTLNHPTDSVYSVMGIVNRIQLIADRTVLLGEIRGDLVQTTEAASSDLKRLADFDMSQANKYNQIADYFAVINNCNYYIANVDTTLQRRGRNLFLYEYAVVKAFRAWAYLEMAKAYGEVPLVTKPMMTEREAATAAAATPASIEDICNFFITDLTPYALTPQPQFGTINGWDSKQFFIPMRPLLGDLCLWAGRYEEAARWYNSYLNDKDVPISLNTSNRVQWTSITEYQRPRDGYSATSTREALSFIPMENRVFDGIISDLRNIFASTTENRNYYQAEPSKAMRQLSAEQVYCMEYKTETSTDTVYAPRLGFVDDLLIGDLRLSSNYSTSSVGAQDPYSEYSNQKQSINKLRSDIITTYRRTMVYLRYAEALNRAGLPQSAFAILKYGLCNDHNSIRIDSLERIKAGELIAFDENIFTHETVIGIHSIGSGDSDCNAYYEMPQPASTLASREDTINYQIPIVEDMIINEMALEGAFEGYRFYDLMRVALRRNDPAYLANPISRRNGAQNDALRALLMNQKNWYLPKQ